MHEKVESLKTFLGWVDVAWSGEGPTTLVEMHGWCSSKDEFAPLNKILERSYRIAAIDWPGHGSSQMPRRDFTTEDMKLVADEVVRDLGPRQIVLLACGHSGWIALDLCRRIGARIGALIVLNWDMTMPPPAAMEALQRIRASEDPEFARQRASSWSAESAFFSEIDKCLATAPSAANGSMWQRAAREISHAYEREGAPLEALGRLESPPRTLHLFSQPTADGYLRAQAAFAQKHAWFHAHRLPSPSTFPARETPHEVASAIVRFLQHGYAVAR